MGYPSKEAIEAEARRLCIAAGDDPDEVVTGLENQPHVRRWSLYVWEARTSLDDGQEDYGEQHDRIRVAVQHGDMSSISLEDVQSLLDMIDLQDDQYDTLLGHKERLQYELGCMDKAYALAAQRRSTRMNWVDITLTMMTLCAAVAGWALVMWMGGDWWFGVIGAIIGGVIGFSVPIFLFIVASYIQHRRDMHR